MHKAGIVIFVEGDTEVEFYKCLIGYLSQKYPVINDYKVYYRNVHGIGNFKGKSVRLFKNQIHRKDPDMNYSAILCYDTDVFEEYTSKPPLSWPEVESELKKAGVKEVFHLKAKKSIEDWF